MICEPSGRWPGELSKLASSCSPRSHVESCPLRGRSCITGVAVIDLLVGPWAGPRCGGGWPARTHMPLGLAIGTTRDPAGRPEHRLGGHLRDRCPSRVAHVSRHRPARPDGTVESSALLDLCLASPHTPLAPEIGGADSANRLQCVSLAESPTSARAAGAWTARDSCTHSLGGIVGVDCPSGLRVGPSRTLGRLRGATGRLGRRVGPRPCYRADLLCLPRAPDDDDSRCARPPSGELASRCP